jgi:threonine aldolase
MKIDLRSDTVTKPSKEMLECMLNAPVGDDVFGEDPTVNELEKYAAEIFGKEAALFCSSGTQTNQIAINVHVTPGGEVICHKESHVYKYEGGGIARNSGASVRLLDGNRGRISAEDVKNWINPEHDVHFPLTQLISIEDTSNRGGGAIYDFDEIKRLAEISKSSEIPLHLDGARVFNALVETEIDYKSYASQFDSISICLSKGLGAPVGSLLLGSKSFISKAHRVRKVFGGGMRQAGYLAAAGMYALDHHIDRLVDDHNNALTLSEALSKKDFVTSILPVETNIVIATIGGKYTAASFAAILKDKGILVIAMTPTQVRFVFHLDIHENDLAKTIDTINTL